jgi:PAS domain S-box-containing protein
LHAEATKATEPGVGADVRRSPFGELRAAVPALLVLIVSLAATAVTWYVLRTQSEANGATDFEDDTRQLAQTIGVGMQGYEETLHAVAALFATSRVVTRDDWRRFVDTLELGRDHPGIEVLGFAKQLHAQQQRQHEREMQAQGLPDYRIWPDRIRDDAVAVTFIEPFSAEARRSLGYDLLADPVSRRAVEAAHASAGVSLSGPWVPAAARNRGPAHEASTVLMVEPLYPYQSESTRTDATQRVDPVGYVYAALDCNLLMADLLHESVVDVGFAVYDGAGTSGGALLYANTRARDLLRAGRKSAFESNIPLTVAGHRWTLRFLSGPYEQAVPHRPLQWIVLAAGIPLSLLLFGIAWSQATLRARATRIALDMTRSVRAQAGLLDLTHDTVFLRDYNNIIRYWNRAASDTYGYSAEEAVGRTADDLLKTRFPAPLEQIWRELEETGKWGGELVHTRRDGTEIVVASRWAVQRDAQGRIESILETNNDVTEHRRVERERRRLEASLLQASKLEAMGTLAGGIAHDFNNILGSILGYGELAESEAPAGSALRRYIDNIMVAGHRAKSLIARILAFSRSGLVQRRPVHVQSIVAETLDLLSASLPESVQVERNLAVDDAAVVADPTQVHQVVLNLCTNAVQAMKDGGTLRIDLEVIEVHAPLALMTGTLPPDRYVRLSVSDTGPGIDPGVRDRVFDPFFTTKGVGVGTGLGLSLVHGIATDLGGAVDMQSELGRGTTFHVYLPCRECAAPIEEQRQALPQGNGETVMLVDDEETLVRLGEEIIAKLGYEPVGYTSPVEALEAFRADPQRFDVVLSDETMPGMTGSQLAERIRAINGEVPIVLMSGYAAAPLAARALAVGAVDVLNKPLLAHDIARALEGALHRRAQR